jgi:putative ABC transport system substrate-binding protein
MINSIRKVVVACVVSLSLIAICAACTKQLPQKQVKRIGITQIATHPGIDAIRQGFLDQMRDAGFTNGTVEYIQTNANGDMSTAQSIAQQLVDEKVDLIFAITTPSSQACAKAIQGTSIPMVFGAVTEPISAGLVKTLEAPGGNITGTSDKWPIAQQFDLLIGLAHQVKRIGLVYNPGETNSEANVKEVEQVCAARGLELVRVPVSSTNEVYAAAQSLVGRIDAFYVPADNTVIAAMDAVVKVSEANAIPLLPGVSSNVEQGGFGTLGPDYYDIGVESAKLAVRVLNGESAGSLPVSTAKRFEYYFNLRSAKATGITIPEELLKKAVKVFE